MSKSCQRQKYIFQIRHFTDTCVVRASRTRVGVLYVSDMGYTIYETCSCFIS